MLTGGKTPQVCGNLDGEQEMNHFFFKAIAAKGVRVSMQE